ncbi:MAG: hypothetical protein BWY87_00156 [Deltaproteobacteria bacterium ADurb.Bin510]|jgi:hypothetical protein|nr:MAG: hypothetical protein BWY87_00156 [Deltaproteobacteria bacterium ADurb.Bin510]
MDKEGLDYFNFGKRISLEVGVDVHLKLNGVGFPLQSTVVGMEADEYLIIKSPKPLYRSSTSACRAAR